MEEQKLLLEKANAIKMIPIQKSSNIAGIGYSEDDQILKVVFKNKDSYSTYLYESVEPNVYKALLDAPSIGKALSEHIIRQKEKYKFLKL